MTGAPVRIAGDGTDDGRYGEGCEDEEDESGFHGTLLKMLVPKVVGVDELFENEVLLTRSTIYIGALEVVPLSALSARARIGGLREACHC